MSTINRRSFLQATSAAALMVHGSSPLPLWAKDSPPPSERLRAACIGLGQRAKGVARDVAKKANLIALCDVDMSRADKSNDDLADGKVPVYQDYRKLLDKEKLDFVVIMTPDHWHTKIATEAMRRGLDVYCEKPLTLTIDEGKLLCRTVKDTKRVLQVGTQQRSSDKFQKAVALVRSGRLGKIKRVTCAIGGSAKGKDFAVAKPPKELDWNMWQGQTPYVDYIPERCHYTFRWWYEYSGGRMTDWGAHHVDIALWALQLTDTGPETIEPLEASLPMPFEKGYPTIHNGYNTATAFKVRCQLPGGIELFIRDTADDLGFTNGIMFEGEDGRIFVNRGKLVGKPVEDLKDNPLPEDALAEVRSGKPETDHMTNFLNAIRDRSLPISDVYSHHRNLSTCHLASIAIRLNRTLKWDAASENIVGDSEAQSFLARESRPEFAIET